MSRSDFLRQLDRIVRKTQALRWSDAVCRMFVIGSMATMVLTAIEFFLPVLQQKVFHVVVITFLLAVCRDAVFLVFWPTRRRNILPSLVAALSNDADAARFLNAAVDFEENPATDSEALRRTTVESATERLKRIPDSFFRPIERFRKMRNAAIFVALAVGVRLPYWLSVPQETEQPPPPAVAVLNPVEIATAAAAVEEHRQTDRLTDALKRIYRRTRGELVRTLGVPLASLSSEQRSILDQLAEEQTRVADRLRERPKFAVDVTLLHEAEGALRENRLGFSLQRQALVLRRLGVDLQGLTPLGKALDVANHGNSNRSDVESDDDGTGTEPTSSGAETASSNSGGETREMNGSATNQGDGNVDPTQKTDGSSNSVSLAPPTPTTLRRIWGELLPQDGTATSTAVEHVLPAYREKTERYLKSLVSP